MKKLYWILIVIILFFAGDRLVGFVLKKMIADSQFRYSKMYRGEADCDILFMGNSRGLGFYQPYIEEVTGKKTFNLSYNALPLNVGRIFLEDYLKHNKTPEILVLDITMMNRVDTTLVNGFNVYTPYSDGLGELIKDHSKNVFYGGKFSHLYLHNSEIFQRAMFYYSKSDKDWIVDRVINENMINAVDEQKPFYAGPFDWSTEVMMFNELNKMVKIAKENNIKIKLVVSPFFPPFVDKIVNFEHLQKRVRMATSDDFQSSSFFPPFVNRVVKKDSLPNGMTTGMEFYNYADAVQDPTGFGDYQHVNIKGAKIYIDKMKADGIFD